MSVVCDACTASLISLCRALISRFKRRMCVIRARATRAGALLSPRSNLEAASRPLALVNDLTVLWYPQRIFIRSLCRRLTAAVGVFDQLAPVVDNPSDVSGVGSATRRREVVLGERRCARSLTRRSGLS